jgi:hypothetical protein
MPRQFGLYLAVSLATFKAPLPYSAAASHFVTKPPPAVFCGQVDLQVTHPPVIFVPSQPYSDYLAAPGLMSSNEYVSNEYQYVTTSNEYDLWKVFDQSSHIELCESC